jgi:hypothetical protein
MATIEQLPEIRENTYQEWWRLAREMFPDLTEHDARFMRLAYVDGFNNGAHFASTKDGAQWLR